MFFCQVGLQAFPEQMVQLIIEQRPNLPGHELPGTVRQLIWVVLVLSFVH
jgi:hypothetical protein